MLIRAYLDRYHYDDHSEVIDGLSGTYHLPLGHCHPIE